jgi:hypothetical protein
MEVISHALQTLPSPAPTPDLLRLLAVVTNESGRGFQAKLSKMMHSSGEAMLSSELRVDWNVIESICSNCRT